MAMARDPIEQDDVERARRTTLEERVQQMIDTVNFGFRLQAAAIRARFPGATEDEVERRLRMWLAYNERWHLRDG